MTHNDIYIKFMIEYDKANVTSSYPSLTEYEVATLLDKAYNALIAQKVTGNNVRRSAFESDIKSISDLQSLITKHDLGFNKDNTLPENVRFSELPSDFLYYVNSLIAKQSTSDVTRYETAFVANGPKEYTTIANATFTGYLVDAKNFSEDYSILAQIKQSLNNLSFGVVSVLANESGNIKFANGEDSYYKAIQLSAGDSSFMLDLEDCSNIYNFYENYEEAGYSDWNRCIFIDCNGVDLGTIYFQKETEIQSGGMEYDGIHNRSLPVKLILHREAENFFVSAYNMPWIKNPVCYIQNNRIYIIYDSIKLPDFSSFLKLLYIRKPFPFAININDARWPQGSSFFSTGAGHPGNIEFECNDTVAEELISLAVAFALENVESLRLNSKLNMRGLEA